MTLQIQVGPPQLVIHQGPTVWIAETNGQVPARSQKGLLYRDTRLISYYQLYANGEGWELLNGAAVTHFAARVFLTNRDILTQQGVIPARSLTFMLGRWASGGVHEDFDITNHGMQPVRFNLELSIRSDFADLFEVKSGLMPRRGRITTEWSEAGQSLRSIYENQDFHRGITVEAHCDAAAVYANGRISFDVALPPGGHFHACLLYSIIDSDTAAEQPAPTDCAVDIAGSAPAANLVEWRKQTTKLQTSNEEVYRTYTQAVDDFAALRLPVTDGGRTVVLPVAGLPWFVALFGRDSLIVAMQTAPVTTAFAYGTLEELGRRQAREIDNYRDAEPGKILHEMRHGELAHFKLIPHTPYFGTADATPLYLMALHTAWRWTGDRGLIERTLEVAERCLGWIDQYGDRDGDGFQEYQTRSPQGYENMGWKDAGDAVLYPDGGMVKGPKALCELQGYVYAAWTGMAEIYDALGKTEQAAVLRERAQALFDRFNEAFWNEDIGFYAFALDGDKRQVLSVVSNVGHCLWTGIIRPDRARRVVERLLAPDMFSGWGIRTLSATHPAFNPHSYHNGSVWPHDNGLIAQGFKRYGFAAEAARVSRAISSAASFFTLHQVPELFSGIDRAGSDFPVQFLGANVPQAWASGSAFSFLQSALGLEPDAPNGRLYVNPTLPPWLPDLTLSGLRLGEQSFDIRFWRDADGSRFEVLKGDDDAVRLKPNE